MYKEHLDLDKPDFHQRIWHYFSLSKFLGLIEKSSLYLCRHDKFDDSFEGGLSEMDKKYFESVHPGMHEYMTGDKVGCYYSNCWTKSDIDEYVLWNSYASLKDGIAVQSTVERLIASLNIKGEQDVYISDVLYLDYSKDYTFSKTRGQVNTLAPHFTKRNYFSSEKELRVMHVDTRGKFAFSPEGINIKVKLDALIERVYLAPFSYPWFADVISNIMKKYSLANIEVLKSSI